MMEEIIHSILHKRLQESRGGKSAKHIEIYASLPDISSIHETQRCESGERALKDTSLTTPVRERKGDKGD